MAIPTKQSIKNPGNITDFLLILENASNPNPARTASEKSVIKRSLVGWEEEMNGRLSWKGILAISVGKANKRLARAVAAKKSTYFFLVIIIASSENISGRIPTYPKNSP